MNASSYAAMAFKPLLLLLLAAAAVRASDTTQCSSFDECCRMCGDDSYRCARGPCSTSFYTKGFFSISVPTESVGFWDVVFSFYGMVPYLVPIVIALDLILYKRTWARVFAFWFIPIVAVVNVIIVKILGDCADCARPCDSCVPSNGMPSGHAANAVGLCLWFLLEIWRGFGQSWSSSRKVILSLADLLLFIPVPYSRIYLGDHTALQVGVGSSDGIVLSIIYFVVARFVLGKRLNAASDRIANWPLHIHVINDFYEKDSDEITPGTGAFNYVGATSDSSF